MTILPAGQTLGVTEQLPLVERHLYNEDYLHATLAVRLGGRAAELVEFGQGSTGASNDLAGATDLAVKMVREFGLSPKLGPVGYPSGGSAFLGGGGEAFTTRPFAESTQAEIDKEVAVIARGGGARRRPFEGSPRRAAPPRRSSRRERDGRRLGRLPDRWQAGARASARRRDAARAAPGRRRSNRSPRRGTRRTLDGMMGRGGYLDSVGARPRAIDR